MEGRRASSWHEELRRVEATVWAIEHCVAPSPRRNAWLAQTLRAWALLMAHTARLGTGKHEAWGGE
jgi:hypothetical protein